MAKLDLVVACDAALDPSDRRAAYQRYEVHEWADAVEFRGLLLQHIDHTQRSQVQNEIELRHRPLLVPKEQLQWASNI